MCRQKMQKSISGQKITRDKELTFLFYDVYSNLCIGVSFAVTFTLGISQHVCTYEKCTGYPERSLSITLRRSTLL